MKFVLLSGSFRSQSSSLAILAHVQRHLAGHDCVLPQLEAVPFYNGDLDGATLPQAVEDLVAAIAAADGLIICTPEYNHSLPAVLKNAIDWASRPAFDSVLRDKPVSIITQSAGAVGGARVQAHLKLVLDAVLVRLQPIHEMLVPGVGHIFDDAKHVTDPKTAARLDRHIDDFVAFVERG